jgi:hypothetical protein
LGKLPQIAQFYAGLFGQVEDGAYGVSAASFGYGVGEEFVGFFGVVLGAGGAEAVKVAASVLAHAVGYGKGHFGVLVEVGCYVGTGVFYQVAEAFQRL